MYNKVDFRLGLTHPIDFNMDTVIPMPFHVERVVSIPVYTDWGKARVIDANGSAMVIIAGGDTPVSIATALEELNIGHVIISGGGVELGPITQILDSAGVCGLALLGSVETRQIAEISGHSFDMAIYVNDGACAPDIAQALSGIEDTQYIISDSEITLSLSTVVDDAGAATLVLQPESTEVSMAANIELDENAFILDVERKLLRIGEFDPHLLEDLDRWTAENGIPIQLKLHVRQIEGENGVIGLVIEASDDVSAEIIDMLNDTPGEE